MLRRLVPLVLCVLALALAGGAYLLVRGGGERRSAEPVTRGARAVAPAAVAKPLAVSAAPAGAPATAEAARGVARTAYERELAAARVVRGRVVFPEGTPPDERARVVARGEDFQHGPLDAADVARDGAFEVRFASGTRVAKLVLEARWLYLADEPTVDLESDAPITLSPRLGGSIRGRVRLPEGDADGAAGLREHRVRLSGFMARDPSTPATGINRLAELDADLAYEIRVLPVEARYALAFDSGLHPSVSFDSLRVDAGRETVLDVELEPGASLAGVVVDESGAPIAGAGVEAEDRAGRFVFGRTARRMVSGADGAFALRGLASGRQELEVEKAGYEPLRHVVEALAPGESRADLRLVLRRGGAITGTVTWPDGTPAEGATVHAERDPLPNWDDRGGSVAHADAAGRFTLTGLEAATYRVRAEGVLASVEMRESRLTGKMREKKVRTRVAAVATGIEPGADVALALSSGLVLAGRALDDRGTPIPAFEAAAARIQRVVHGTTSTGHVRKRFEDPRGAFEIDGLLEGDWRITVQAEGHVDRSLEVALPQSAPLEVRLEREARIAGVVLRPSGEPAPAGATIEVLHPAGGWTWTADGRMRDERPAGEEGRFEVGGIRAGAISVRATQAGLGPSPWVDLTLAPGAAQTGLVLRLSEGVRLTGVVLGFDGEPLPRRTVKVRLSEGAFQRTLQSDDAGAFELLGLEIGTYVVSAEPTAAEAEAFDATGVAGVERVLAREVEVEVGPEGAHVVLAPPESDVVRVHGSLLFDGEPFAATLYLHGEGQPAPPTELRPDGSFEVLVPRPATYQLSAEVSAVGLSIGSTVPVEGPREERVDLDLEVGTISGRVLGPAGPIAGLAVRAMRRHVPGDTWWASARARTDEDGRYSFDLLPEGTWTVAAGGYAEWWNESDADLRHVETKREGLVLLPDAEIEDVDLGATEGGWIAGKVEGRGGLGSQVRVLVRGEDGAIVNGNGAYVAPDGTFLVPGLAPGVVDVHAVGKAGTTARETRATVEVGRETRVDLELVPGTRLVVRMVRGGAPVDAHVQCTRADGKSFDVWTDWSRRELGERVIGPLPAGTYVVAADLEGSRRTERSVVIDGAPEVEIALP